MVAENYFVFKLRHCTPVNFYFQAVAVELVSKQYFTNEWNRFKIGLRAMLPLSAVILFAERSATMNLCATVLAQITDFLPLKNSVNV